MSLILQIQSIAYTFLFGIYFSLTFNLLYKILFTKHFVINIITNFFFVILNSILYFYLLFLINNGIIHIYLFFIFLISFFLYNFLFRKIRTGGWKISVYLTLLWFNLSWKIKHFLV